MPYGLKQCSWDQLTFQTQQVLPNIGHVFCRNWVANAPNNHSGVVTDCGGGFAAFDPN